MAFTVGSRRKFISSLHYQKRDICVDGKLKNNTKRIKNSHDGKCRYPRAQVSRARNASFGRHIKEIAQADFRFLLYLLPLILYL